MSPPRLAGLVTALLVLAAAPDASASNLWKHPNTHAYHVSPEQFWSGRSGNSMLSARALMNSAGLVTLEVTAGEFESSTPSPGKLSFVTVVSLGGHGGTNILKTYLLPSGPGTWSKTYTGLKRGQPFIVLAGVRGMEGPWVTRLVTVGGRVKLAPDLGVTQINAPANAPVGMPVMLLASIEELNTDVGARTDCVLSVDGQAVDEARGIWVDSGGLVTCAFSYAFPTVGRKNLRGSLVNTRPLDFDVGNDAAEGTIDIISPVTGMSFNAWLEDRVFDYGGFSRGYYRQPNGSYLSSPDWESTWGGSGWTQVARINAWVAEHVPFNGTTLRVRQETGGEVVHEAEYVNITPTFTNTDVNGNVNECAGRWDTARSMHLYYCTTGGAQPRTQIEYFREAGQAIYWSRLHGQSWQGWHQNYEWSMNTGTAVLLGSDYRMRVELERGEDSWVADTTLALTAVTRRHALPFRCWEEPVPGGNTGRVCTEEYDNLDGWQGQSTNP